jgi:hypothetical protein
LQAGVFLLDIISCGVQSNSTMLKYLDFWVATGLLAALFSFFFCILYSVMRWNKGFEEKHGDYKAEIQWEREEIELIERLP